MKGFHKVIWAFFFIFSFSFCSGPINDLTSSDPLIAEEAAKEIFSGGEDFSVSLKNVSDYLSALYSDNAYVARAALKSAENLDLEASLFLLSHLTNESFPGDIQKSAVEEVLTLTNYTVKTFPAAKIRLLSAKKLSGIDPALSLFLIQEALSFTNDLTNSTREDASNFVRIAALAGGAYSRLSMTNEAFSLFDFALSRVEDYWEEDIKNELYADILPQIAENSYDQVEELWDEVFSAAKNYWSNEGTAGLYRLLVQNLAAQETDEAYRAAYLIYNYYNEEYYADAVLAAKALYPLDAEKGEAIFELAYTMASDVGIDDGRYAAQAEVASAWMDFKADLALSKITDVMYDDSLRAELLSKAALLSAEENFDRSIYYLGLIIHSSNRVSGIANILPYADENKKEKLFELTNGISNLTEIEKASVYSLAKDSPQEAYEAALSISGEGEGLGEFFLKFASSVAETDSDLSANSFRVLLGSLEEEDSESNRLAMFSNFCAALSEVKSFAASSLWDQAYLMADEMISATVRIQALRIRALYYARYDYASAQEGFHLLDSLSACEVAENRLNSLDEGEILKSALSKTGTNTFPVLISWLDDEGLSQTASALMKEIAKNSTVGEPFLSQVAEVLSGDEVDSFVKEDLISIFSVQSDLAYRTLMDLSFDSNQSMLYDEISDAFRLWENKSLEDKDAEKLIVILSNRQTSDEVKESAVNLLKIFGENAYVKEISDVLKSASDDGLKTACIEALVQLGASDYSDSIRSELSDDELYPLAARALGALGEKDKLIASYNSLSWSEDKRFFIMESLMMNFSAEREKEKLGYTGFIFDGLIHAFQMKGWVCIPVESREEGFEMGCERVLEGTNTVEYGYIGEYFDPNSPGGVANAGSESLRATIRLYSEDGWSLWSMSGYSWSYPYDSEDQQEAEGIELQDLVHEHGMEQLYTALRKKLSSSRSSIPFNF